MFFPFLDLDYFQPLNRIDHGNPWILFLVTVDREDYNLSITLSPLLVFVQVSPQKVRQRCSWPNVMEGHVPCVQEVFERAMLYGLPREQNRDFLTELVQQSNKESARKTCSLLCASIGKSEEVVCLARSASFATRPSKQRIQVVILRRAAERLVPGQGSASPLRTTRGPFLSEHFSSTPLEWTFSRGARECWMWEVAMASSPSSFRI